MSVKLHRCSALWVKIDGHPCWRVQKALDEAGVDYEIVPHAWAPWSKRPEIQELSGQRKLPVIELEDGTVIREESARMAERVRAGEFSGGGGPPAT
jgi:glutathione S-transferase